MPAKTFISISDPRWRAHGINFARVVRAAIRAAGRVAGPGAQEVSIVLTNDAGIRELNKKYRGIDRPTNVLSFETGDPELLGDIFISYDTVERESKALRARAGPVKAFRCQSDFFSAHAAHMAAHGVLHLLGYDHASDSDADRMEAMESAILADLGLPDPYAGDRAARNSAWPRRLLRAGLAFLCGAAASFGFAPFYLWPMTFVGIGGAYILCARRAGGNRKFSALSFLDPAFFGAGYAAASFWWVLNSIYVVPELAAQFAAWTAPGLLGIALAGAGIFGLPFILTQLSGAAGWRRPVVFALSWATVLWLREWAFTGFPWNPLSNISFFWPALANSMSLWGALGLTFVLAGLIAATAELFARRGRRMLATTAAFYLLAAAGCIAGHFNIRKTEASSADDAPLIRLVQPAEAQSVKMGRADAGENVRKLTELSRRGPPADIVIWPETAYPYVALFRGADLGEVPAARAVGAALILGALSADADDLQDGQRRVFNSMVVAGPDGNVRNIYHKSHLVPFGEYSPWGGLLPAPGTLTPGRGPEIIDLTFDGGTQERVRAMQFVFAPAICYEVIFTDSLLPETSGGGQPPRAIVNITNDTWFGSTPGPHQHLDMARRYAIESGLPVARANYSGISAFISADGRVAGSLGIGVSGVLDGRLSGAHETAYRRIGRDGIMFIILALTAAVCIPGRRRKG